MSKKEFNRTDSLFSLCGLNCGLCPMNVRGGCGGCFTGSPCYLTCPIAPCSVEHGNVEYCFQCSEYPCGKYDGIDSHDSLISHRNQKKDMEKAKAIGIEAYKEEQRKKKEILYRLLEEYDDGSRDVFFCLAANMLVVSDLTEALELIENAADGLSRLEKAEMAERHLRESAKRKEIPLELRP